jgi:hypothetical protein
MDVKKIQSLEREIDVCNVMILICVTIVLEKDYQYIQDIYSKELNFQRMFQPWNLLSNPMKKVESMKELLVTLVRLKISRERGTNA